MVHENATVAAKIEELFQTMHPAGRGPYSLQEVSDGIREQSGTSISVNQLWELRRGKKTNPRRDQLQALARWFKVPARYFFDDDDEAAEIHASLALIGALRHAEVEEIAVRAAKLSSAGRRMVTAVIGHVEEWEAAPRRRGAADGE